MAHNPNRINVWTCEECGKKHVCCDVDDGVTPFMIACRNPGCDGTAYSAFYRVPDAYALLVEYEWFMPSAEERAGETGWLKDYHDGGGLDLRYVGRPIPVEEAPNA